MTLVEISRWWRWTLTLHLDAEYIKWTYRPSMNGRLPLFTTINIHKRN
jgi:hypothetical protein